MDPDAVARLGATLLDALASVHQAGVCHGDIKPENLLYSASDVVPVHLIDFGLAGGMGGTAAWAAPEQLSGGGASEVADVYSAGLVLWACLHGGLPFGSLSPEEGLARRCCDVPAVSAGPDWLRKLVQQLLAVDPDQRPLAADAADRFAAQGVPLSAVTGPLIERRAQVAYVQRPALARGLDRWLERGGRIGLIGPSGSGRTRELDRVAVELAARGRSCLRVPADAGDHAWASISIVLEALQVELPVAPDDATRAHRIASIIVDADRPVLVDSFEQQDPMTSRVVRILCAEGADVCIAAEERLDELDGSATHCVLGPFDRDQLQGLLADLLGDDAEIPGLLAWVSTVSGGHPGAVGRAVGAAVDAEALIRLNRTWAFDAARAPSTVAWESQWRLPTVDSLAGQVLEVLAVHSRALAVALVGQVLEHPVGVAQLRDVVGALVDAGLAYRTPAGLACSASVRTTVLERALHADALRWRLLQHMKTLEVPPLATIVELAVAVGDRATVMLRGGSAIDLLRTRNPVEAARLADEIWAMVPTSHFAVSRVRALVAAGRTADARAFGDERWAERATGHDVELLVQLAQIAATNDGDAEGARAWVERSRVALDGRPSPASLDLVDAVTSDILGEHERALELAQPLCADAPPQESGELEIWLRARLVAAQSMHHLGRLDDAIVLLETVPAKVGVGMGARAVMSAALGRLLWFAGRFKDADAALCSAASGDSGLPMLDRARLLNNLGAVRHNSGNRPLAVTAWEQALVLFRRLDAAHEQARALVNLCLGYKELGRWERARGAGESAQALAARLGLRDLECNAALNLAELDIVMGELASADRLVVRAMAIAESMNLDREMVEARLRAVEIATLQRRSGLAHLAEVEAVRDAASTLGMMLESCLASALLAVNYARAGGVAVKLDGWIQEATEPLQAAGAAADLAVVRLWVAEALLDADRAEEAAGQVDRVRLFAREAGIVPLSLRADQLGTRIGARWRDPKRDARVSQLVTLAVAINEQADLRSVLDRIAEASMTLLECDRAFVLMGEPTEVVASASTGLVQGEPSMSVVRQCIEDDREVIAADLDERSDLRDQRSIVALELRSVLCVPMRHQDTIIGAIYVDSRTASQRHLWESAELMRGLAAMAAVAVVKVRYFEASVKQARVAARLAERERAALELAEKNKQLQALNARLRKAVVTDPLTGLFNRRHLMDVLGGVHTECQSSTEDIGYGVIVCDIDHFKRVNDTWGHAVGDRVLIETAQRMREGVRSGDLVFRYGGEEMVVLTRTADAEGLRALGERLRMAVCGSTVEMGDNEHRTISVSVGCASYRRDEDADWSALVQRADMALYAAKDAGRNCVMLAGDNLERATDVA